MRPGAWEAVLIVAGAMLLLGLLAAARQSLRHSVDSDARPVSLGCGTLLLIALIVGIVGGGAVRQLERKIDTLQRSATQLQQTVADQANEIGRLRVEVSRLRQGSGPPAFAPEGPP